MVLGYGTTTGGKMKPSNNSYTFSTYRIDEEGYLMDTDKYPYKQAISKINENNLSQLAKNMNIEYINASNTSKLNSKINEIKKGIKYNEVTKTTGGTDYYYLFSIPLLGLFIYELINYRRDL